MNLDVFWAKFGDGSAGSLSLRQHLTDVSGVILAVAHRLLPAARYRLLEERCGGDLDKILRFAAWSHDVGKASPWFQGKVPELNDRVLDAGYPMVLSPPHEVREMAHGLVSAYTVVDWLAVRASRKPGRRANRAWFSVLGGHHGAFPHMGMKPDPLVDEPEEWRDARFRLLDLGVRRLGLTQEDIDSFANLSWDIPDQVLVTGLLISADWVGSSETNFPYDCDAATDQEERAAEGCRRMGLGGRWTPSPVDAASFCHRFGLPADATVRPVQEAVVRTVRAMNGPGLVLVEDATGGGKTEAALMAADVWAEQLGLDGVFFGQPTRVTSDAMFNRVLTWLENSPENGEVSTILAHGKAQFNESYLSLFGSARPMNVYGSDVVDEGLSPEANSWFRGRKTGLLASVVVGTIDQLLFAALKSKHVALRHLGLFGKVVILDEIHAADDFMTVYLTRILEWLGVYGVPVIALSATLPPERRQKLADAYATGASRFEIEHVELEENTGYPQITWVGCDTSGSVLPDGGDRIRQTRVEFLPGDLEEMAEAVITAAHTGGCIAAICNTVSRAQQLFELLDGKVDNLSLLHSRFLTDHRAGLEGELVNALGRGGEKARRPGRVVISTQVIEQGLDLDFDLMFSDVAPVDLLIQRMGRLHRHDFAPGVRPRDKVEAQFVITGCSEFGDERAPEFPRAIEAVYRRYRLLRSVLTLSRHLKASSGIVESPRDVVALVSSAYEDALIPPVAWEEVWSEAESREEVFRVGQEQKARQFRLPQADNGELSTWSVAATTDAEIEGLAQVRDADDSVEVVVVQRIGGRISALPHVSELDGVALDEVMAIDVDHARRLAQCTVRLPAWVMRTDAQFLELEKDGQESWQSSPWLKGVLPLVLDERGERTVGDWLLRYDNRLGLLCERLKG
ncbi:putative CRISPR-associated helicase Cas3 family protein [Corynebacterium terpenotabidum Y-11]|uniref:Putative CRISPR-associated helicase Cas3 family protein n=2 Tax=Corynebacterium terpenotabidum TaxID=89154 RepID=S4XHI3_9CORY|nr:putative CRISPR-associated helicase Cas3 family protein [Corynebacterium terpenotabidum Y-11]